MSSFILGALIGVVVVAVVVLLSTFERFPFRVVFRPHGRSPVDVGGGWWLCRDDGGPISYPPAARDELVESRLAMADLRTTALETALVNHVTGETAPGRPAGALGGVTAEGSADGWLEVPIERDPGMQFLSYCLDCGRPLEMLERYMWAPSLAWCPKCCEGPYDVVFDHDASRWDIIEPKEDAP